MDENKFLSFQQNGKRVVIFSFISGYREFPPK